MVFSDPLRLVNREASQIIASPLKVHGGRANGDTGTRVREDPRAASA